MINTNQKKSGVTLIELIIVVVIISVIATFAVSKISTAGDNSKIDAMHIAAKTLAAGIRQAEVAGVDQLIVTRSVNFGNFTDSASSDYLTTSLGQSIELWVEGVNENPATLNLGANADDFILVSPEVNDLDSNLPGEQIYLRFDKRGNYIGAGINASDYTTPFTKA